MLALRFGLAMAARLALLSTLWSAGSAWAGLFDDDLARRQINELKASLEARSDMQAKAQLDLAGQIQRQADEIARLQGQIETLMYELDTARKRQQDFYVDLDTRVRQLETAPPPAAAVAPPAAPGEVVAPMRNVLIDPQAENREYESALGHFRAGRYKEAVAGFSAFVQKYAESTLAPNAQFWLGNAWYAQRDCRKAIEAQTRVTSYWPDHAKAPEALLAIATCQQELANLPAAKKALEMVLARYPSAPAADEARQRLKKK